MITSLEKLIKKIILKRYPMILDIEITEDSYFYSNVEHCYNVFLLVEDRNETPRSLVREIEKLIVELSRYMDVKVCGVFLDNKE